MGPTPISSPGEIGHHFSGMAANESFGKDDQPPHIWIMDDLNQEISLIIDSFHTLMTGVLRQMDIDYALEKQMGMIDGEKLKPGQTPEKRSIDLACSRSLENSFWALAVQSFHDYTMQNDPEKYKQICLKMSPDSAEALLDKALLQDEHASVEIGLVLQQALLDDIDALNKLKAMITHNIPTVQVKIEMRTQELDSSEFKSADDKNPRFLMTPVIALTALEDLDLRVPLRRYVDSPQSIGPGGLKPA